MRYVSVNELDAFAFHDACTREIALQDGRLICVLERLCVCAGNSANDTSEDMCISRARLTLEELQVLKIELWGKEAYDSDGRRTESRPPRALAESEFDSFLRTHFGAERTAEFSFLCDFKRCDDRHFSAVFSLISPEAVDLTLSFSGARVEWDEYAGRAWYLANE